MDIADLLAGPLDEFVGRRKELVTELKARGDQEGAAAAAKLRKPSVVVWTLDRLHLDDPDGVEDLLEAGRRIRSEHPEEVRQGVDARKSAVARLRRTAESTLKDSGHSPSHADAVARALLFIAPSDDLGQQLRDGTFTEEPTAAELTGFEAAAWEVGGAEPAIDERQRRAREKAEQLAEEAAALEQRAATLSKEADVAELAAEQARAAATQAEAKARSARERADRAVEEL